MKKVKISVVQMSCSRDRRETLEKAEHYVRKAAAEGGRIILLQELFETRYFCQKENYQHYELASLPDENPAILRFEKIAEELAVVIPVSFFEKSGNVFYNSVAVIDADGSNLGIYRKSHIPDGPAYEEKFYFTPGNTGFKVWKTRYADIGIGICWDQWFPEAARCMALMGAEILFYPTAIGSEPILPVDSRDHWMRCIKGHAAANLIPVAVANRVGTEDEEESSMTFYGSSFITDGTGRVLVQADREEETVLTVELDLDECRRRRVDWGVFRDRRPDLYRRLLS